MKSNKPLVLMDGTAASGKSTAAELFAKHKGYQYINSGLLYRATGIISFENEIAPALAAANLTLEDLGRSDLDSEFVGGLAAKAAKDPDVRIAINEAIRKMIARGESGTAMCGRAGFAEFPEATLKFYITASDEECARRRFLQQQKKGKPVVFEDLMQKIKQRNEEDYTRPVSPMRTFEEAKSLYDLAIDNTEMQAEEMLQCILEVAERLLLDTEIL